MTRMTAAQLKALAASNPKAFRALARKNDMSVRTHTIDQIAEALADVNGIAAEQTEELLSILTTLTTAADLTTLGMGIVATLKTLLNEGEPNFTDVWVEDIATKMGKTKATIKGALSHLHTAGYTYTQECDPEPGRKSNHFIGLTDKGWAFGK